MTAPSGSARSSMELGRDCERKWHWTNMCPSASETWCTRWKKPSGNEKAEISARMTRVVANMKLPADVHLHAPGTRFTVKTVEQALGLIDASCRPKWRDCRAGCLRARSLSKRNAEETGLRSDRAAARPFRTLPAPRNDPLGRSRPPRRAETLERARSQRLDFSKTPSIRHWQVRMGCYSLISKSGHQRCWSGAASGSP